MMRSLLILAMSALMLPVFAAGRMVPAVGGVKVDFALENPPRLNWKSQQSTVQSKTQPVNRLWGVITVDFYPGEADADKHKTGVNIWDKGEIRLRKAGWLQDVSLRVRVLFPTDESDGKSKVRYGLFTGSTLLWWIPLDNSKHVAKMLIPSQLIERYITLRGSSANERQARKDDFIIEAAFVNRDGRIIGVGYRGVRVSKGETEETAFARLMEKAVPESTVEGAVLPRDKTPWYLYDFDQYDLIKPDVTESVPHGKR